MLKLILSGVLCWTVAVAAPEGLFNITANGLMDLMLDQVDQAIIAAGLDPAALPEVKIDFSQKVLFVTWHGEASAYNGTMEGMSTLHRKGDAEFIETEEGHLVGVTSSLGMNELKGSYKYLSQFMDIGPKGDISITVDGVQVSFSAALNEHRCFFEVQNLNIDKIGHISIKIHGLGLLDWITNIFASAIANTMEIFLRGIFEFQFKSIMNGVFDQYDLYKYRLLPFIHCDKRPHSSVTEDHIRQ